jgi:hypothetical protein
MVPASLRSTGCRVCLRVRGGVLVSRTLGFARRLGATFQRLLKGQLTMNLSRKFLAGAIVALLPISGAMACTTSAWSSVSGAPVAGDPMSGDGDVTSRYSGSCGLKTAAGGSSFVVSDHPSAENIYRARFYVLTTATANATVFQAYSDAGATTPVITVEYQPGASAFAFTIPGAPLANVTSILPNQWYGIEIFRQVGAPAVVTVQGGGGNGFDPVDGRNEQNIPRVLTTVNSGASSSTPVGALQRRSASCCAATPTTAARAMRAISLRPRASP